MDKKSEEKIRIIQQMAKEPAAKFKNAEQALENAMEAAEGDLEMRVEIAKQVFEIALELPTKIAVRLGESIFQYVEDFRMFREVTGSDEFVKYVERYHEDIVSSRQQPGEGSAPHLKKSGGGI